MTKRFASGFFAIFALFNIGFLLASAPVFAADENQGAGPAPTTASCTCGCAFKDTYGNTTQSTSDAQVANSYASAEIACASVCTSLKKDGEEMTASTPTCTPAPVSCKCSKGAPAAQAFSQKDCADACTTAKVMAAAKSATQVEFVLPKKDFPAIFGRIIKAILGISGSLTLTMIVYGGFLYLTSGGAPETITKAKNIVMWAVLGLVIIFTSYAAVSTIFKAASSATGAKLQSGQVKQ